MNELIAAFLGAVAAGSIQFFIAWRDRKTQTEAMLTAIACEVDAICNLLRHQKYVDFFNQARREIEAETWDGHGLVIDIRSNYFSVFESLAPQIGYFQPHQVNKIVSFYCYCKSAIDSTRPDGPTADRINNVYVAEGILSVEQLLNFILAFGNEIGTFPAISISKRSAPTAFTSALPSEHPRIIRGEASLRG